MSKDIMFLLFDWKTNIATDNNGQEHCHTNNESYCMRISLLNPIDVLQSVASRDEDWNWSYIQIGKKNTYQGIG